MSFTAVALTLIASYGSVATAAGGGGAEDGLHTEADEQLLTEAGDNLIWEA